jgi:hypothetical protein
MLLYATPKGDTPMSHYEPQTIDSLEDETTLTERATFMPTKRTKPAVELPNIHPADELSGVREEIKILQARADQLRDQLLAEGADLHGDMYTAVIQPGVRETLDRKAITEAFGEAAIAPFVKATAFKTVKLVEN